MKFKLTSKITISTVLTILFFGVMATFAVYYFVQKTVLDLEKESLLLLDRDASSELNRLFIDNQMLALTITKQPEVVEYFNNPIEQDPAILKMLNQYNIENRYSAIYLMSRTGKALVSTDPSFVGNDYSFRNYFQRAIAGEGNIDIAVGVTSKLVGYYTAVPVRNSKDEIAGVVVAKLRPEVITQLIHQSGITSSGHVMLTDNYGVILYSDLHDRIYKSLGGLSQFVRKEIEKTKKYQDINIVALDYGSVADLISQKKKNGIVEIYDREDKTLEILTFNQVGILPFFLVYEENAKDFSSSAVNVSIILGLFVLFAAVMAAIVIVFLTRRFLLPLVGIINTLRFVGLGKLDKKISIKSSDELGEMAEVFNEMIDNIKDSRENIEKKIQNRTNELEKFNNLMIGREIKMIELKNDIEKLEKGLKKVKIKTWAERFREGIETEEHIIRELESVSLYKIKASDLSIENKEKLNNLIKKLVSDSKRHYKIFEKLAKKDEKK